MSDITTLEGLNELLKSINWDDISKPQYEALPNGYYRCEIESIECKENKNKTNLQFVIRFNVLDSVSVIIDENRPDYIEQKRTTAFKNRKIFKYYPLKDVASLNNFLKDLLLIKDPQTNTQLFPEDVLKELDITTLISLLDQLAGFVLYVECRNFENKSGEKSTWYKLMDWEEVNELRLED